MLKKPAWGLLALLLGVPAAMPRANVITDWDDKAVGVVQTKMVPPAAYRVMAILHLAMFEAVNSVEPRYKPYKAKLSVSPDTSKEAAATAAAPEAGPGRGRRHTGRGDECAGLGSRQRRQDERH
jgi:hypothetical protein